MTERVPRYNVFFKINSKNPLNMCRKVLKEVKERGLIINSLSCDNGLEFSKIGILAYQLTKYFRKKTYVYRCDPYASFERGSNEHSNGIFRRYYKKGTNFNNVSDEEIARVEKIINNMPRKMFEWYSSSEIRKLVLLHEFGLVI